jgi:hypothetical protein
MSGFEFVLVLYAIIAGLGISDILAGWGEQIRARHRLSAYPLQLVLSFLLIYFGITFLWAFWTFRDIVWTFTLYISLATIPLIISLASRVVRVDTTPAAPSAREQYFQNARAVFMLMALLPLVLVLLSFATPIGGGLPNSPGLLPVTVVRLSVCAGMLYLAWSRNAIVHWIGIGTIFLVTLLLSSNLTIRAIEGIP